MKDGINGWHAGVRTFEFGKDANTVFMFSATLSISTHLKSQSLKTPDFETLACRQSCYLRRQQVEHRCKMDEKGD